MRAKEFLSQRGVPYTIKMVDQDRGAAIEMIRLSGQQGVPVISMDGQVIVGFDKARLERLLAARSAGAEAAGVARPSLGAQVADAAPILLKQGKTGLSGAYVGTVRAGSPAAEAGLRTGDVITAAGERLIRTADDLVKAIAPLAPGGYLRLTVQRDGRLQEVTVRF